MPGFGFGRGKPNFAAQASAAALSALYDFTAEAIDPLITVAGGANGTRLTSAGLREAKAAPRIDHDSNGVALGILIEGSRTNLITNSHNFADASWKKIGATPPTITSDAGNGPDGVVTLTDRLNRSAKTSSYLMTNVNKATSALKYALSISAKKVADDYFPVRVQGTYPARADMTVNLATGVVSNAASSSGNFSSVSGRVARDGNGFSRVELRATSDNAATISCLMSTNSLSLAIDNADVTATAKVLLSYPQLEQADFASSPIVPGAAATTRTADDLSMTGASFMQRWGGCRQVDAVARSAAVGSHVVWQMDLAASAANDRATLWLNGQMLTLTIKRGGVPEVELIWPVAMVADTEFSATVRLVDNAASLSVNGGAPMIDGACTMPSFDRMLYGRGEAGSYLFGHIKRLAPQFH